VSKDKMKKALVPDDHTINMLVEFAKDQAGNSLNLDWLDGYKTGLHKMKSLMLDLIEQKLKTK
jgi:hypothetical protein